jgi:hypothetical protein
MPTLRTSIIQVLSDRTGEKARPYRVLDVSTGAPVSEKIETSLFQNRPI